MSSHEPKYRLKRQIIAIASKIQAHVFDQLSYGYSLFQPPQTSLKAMPIIHAINRLASPTNLIFSTAVHI